MTGVESMTRRVNRPAGGAPIKATLRMTGRNGEMVLLLQVQPNGCVELKAGEGIAIVFGHHEQSLTIAFDGWEGRNLT